LAGAGNGAGTSVVVGVGAGLVVGSGGSVTPGIVDPTGTVGSGLTVDGTGATVTGGATVSTTVDEGGTEEEAGRVVGVLRRLVVVGFLLDFARVVVRFDLDLLADFVVALDAAFDVVLLAKGFVVTAPCADADPAAVAISVLIISALIIKAPRVRRLMAGFGAMVLTAGKRDIERPY
jgi:hypothetical protein